MKKTCLFIIMAALLSLNLHAQKKNLTIDDYKLFKSVSQATISDRGGWAGFTLETPRGDDTLVMKKLGSDRCDSIPLGSRVQFSDDEKWAVYMISLPFKKQESLKAEKKPVTMAAELLNLETGKKEKFEGVTSVEFTKGSAMLIIRLKKTEGAKGDGSPVVIKDVDSGLLTRYDNVSGYAVNKPGSLLAFTVEAPDTVGNGLFLVETAANRLRALDTDKAIYSQVTWNEEGTTLACLKGTTPKGKSHRENSLILFTDPAAAKGRYHYDPSDDKNFPDNQLISENRAPAFSSDNSLVYFGIREQEDKVEKKKDDPPVANVDIWHWKDERIQSVQMKRAARDRRFTYLSSVVVADNRFVRIADSTMRGAEISRDGRWVIGKNDKPYISDYKESMSDYYRVNPYTGERTLILKAHKRDLGFSPDSKNFLFWKDGDVWNYTLSAGELYSLTASSDTEFANQEFDYARERPPYGVAGFTKDSNNIILYSRYDLWLQPFDGSQARCLTNNYGSENEIILRYVQTDREEKFIDLTKPLLLSATGQWTKKEGFFSLEKAKLRELVYTDNHYGRVNKAKYSDSYLLTRESPREYSDYYVTDSHFKKFNRISDANPIVDNYNWYSNILIEYTNNDGVRLQGVLMVPETYKPGDKLPMLVDFYEKNSHNLNRWSRVIYRDTPMFPKYASNEYLVLLPDVHFRIGSTHSDHLECVSAAVNKVLEMGYADPERIGLHGHSFSGQGGNYIVTHTDMFACAVIGAGVSNLVSDFNQLWKSSGSNQHGYNYTGQGRFNTNPFDDLQLYIDQSAVYHARDMNTPLLLLQGVDDGSVEWLQAIEFYNALRFNGKNVILASYPGEDHHLAKHENKVDFQTRMEQFYDHYLKGSEAPSWMTKGVPFLEKKGGK